MATVTFMIMVLRHLEPLLGGPRREIPMFLDSFLATKHEAVDNSLIPCESWVRRSVTLNRNKCTMKTECDGM